MHPNASSDKPASVSSTWTPGILLASAGLTLGLFLLIPLLELFAKSSPRVLSIRPVQTVKIQLPAPPTPAREAQPPEPFAPPRPQAPSLTEPPPRLPTAGIPRGTDLRLAPLRGDFDIAFAVASPHPTGATEPLLFQLEDLDEEPRPLVRFPPIYPPQARIRRIEGTVNLEFVVHSDGTVGEIRALAPHSHAILEKAAVNAVRGWRFEPGVKAGAAVPVQVTQQLTFRLEE